MVSNFVQFVFLKGSFVTPVIETIDGRVLMWLADIFSLDLALLPKWLLTTALNDVSKKYLYWTNQRGQSPQEIGNIW